jgi:hypothetical protein
MSVILVTLEAEIKRSWFEASPDKIVCKTLSQKYPTQKRAGRVSQMVERLPKMCEALSSY